MKLEVESRLTSCLSLFLVIFMCLFYLMDRDTLMFMGSLPRNSPIPCPKEARVWALGPGPPCEEQGPSRWSHHVLSPRVHSHWREVHASHLLSPLLCLAPPPTTVVFKYLRDRLVWGQLREGSHRINFSLKRRIHRIMSHLLELRVRHMDANFLKIYLFLL